MKKLLVLKFGGSSVGSPQKIRHVANIVGRWKKKYSHVVVVISAMGKSTDELIDLASKVSSNHKKNNNRREMDMLLSSGERISMALLCMALHDVRIRALSLTGSQSGIITNTLHGEARIQEIRPFRVIEELKKGNVVVVAGFQGVSIDKEITTLGRGGSDTSAIALGVALNAEEVIIYTDVDGIHTADPRLCSNARRIKKISWLQAARMASSGADIMHPRSLQVAYLHEVPLRILNTFKKNSLGTIVKGNEKMLESTKFLGLNIKDNLLYFSSVNLKTKNLIQRGVRIQFYESFSNSKSPNGNILLTKDDYFLYCDILKGGIDCMKITLNGIMLSRKNSLLTDFQKILMQNKCQIIHLSYDDYEISAVIKKNVAPNKIIKQLHKFFL